MEHAAFTIAGASGRLSPAPGQPGPRARPRRSYGGIWVLRASPAQSLLLFIAGRLTSLGTWCCLWALEGGKWPQGAPDHLTVVTSAALRASKAMSSMSSSSPWYNSAIPHRRSRCRGRWASSWDTGSHSTSPHRAPGVSRTVTGNGGEQDYLANPGGRPTGAAPWAPHCLCRGSGWDDGTVRRSSPSSGHPAPPGTGRSPSVQRGLS